MKLFGNQFAVRGIINIVIYAAVAISTYASLLMIARVTGGNYLSDAYFYSMSITVVIAGTFSCIFSVVLLPQYIKITVADGQDLADKIYGSILQRISYILIPTIVIIQIYIEEVVLFFSTYNASQIQLARGFFIYLPGIIFLTVLSEYFKVFLIGRRRYNIVASAGLIQPIIICFSLIYVEINWLDRVLPFLVLSSRLFINILYLSAIIKSTSLKLVEIFRYKSDRIKFGRESSAYWMASNITNVANFAPEYISSGLSSGVLTSISLALRIYNIPISLIITPVMEIARVRFAYYYANDDLKNLSKEYSILMCIQIFILVPCAFFLYVYSEYIALLFFERGGSGSNVVVVKSCLEIYSITLLLSGLFVLNGRIVEASGKTFWTSILGSGFNISWIFLTIALVENIGFKGVPIAKVIMDICFYLPFGFCAVKVINKWFDVEILKIIVGSSVISLVVVLCANYFAKLIVVFELKLLEMFVVLVFYLLIIVLLFFGWRKVYLIK